MKNFNKIYSMLLIAFLVIGCNEDTPNETGGSNALTSGQTFVYLDPSNATSINETANLSQTADGTSITSDNVYTLSVLRNTAGASALTVDYTADVIWTDSTEFAPAGGSADSTVVFSSEGSITIPAGRTIGTLDIAIEDDFFATGNRQISITLSNPSEGTLTFPGSGAEGAASITITIVEDDCPIDIPNVWEGTYELFSLEAAPGSTNEGFALTGPLGLKTGISLDPSDPSSTSVILSGAPFVGGAADTLLFAQNVPLKFETCPGSVIIGSGFYFMNFNQNSAQAAITRSDEPSVYGNGLFEADGSEFTLTVTYSNANFLNFDEFILTFVRVEEE